MPAGTALAVDDEPLIVVLTRAKVRLEERGGTTTPLSTGAGRAGDVGLAA